MTYGTAGLILLSVGVVAALLTRIIHRAFGVEFRRHHHEVGSTVFLQIGVVFAVLLAFVFSEVLDEYKTAGEAIDLEVGALHGAAILMATLPPAPAKALLQKERDYLKSVIYQEWPVMARRRGENAETDRKLDILIAAVANLKQLSPTPLRKGEILSLLAQAHQQRETRIFQASNGIPVAL
ncbi:hypothetical protein [Lichenicoccus sp.]|uniref:bestrophin-like domain n=1 Tax=Lichenicoccus sp. TaxID=2781899 RepID=UPI003D0A07E3